MSCFVVTLVVCLLGQAETDAVTLANKEAIAKAVLQLGNENLSQRAAASKFLWQQGRAAEPALQHAAASPDRETRSRAKKILAEFDYGILPTLPAEDVTILRQFRDGDSEKRSSLLADLAKNGRFEMLVQVLNREPTQDGRRALLLSLCSHPAAVEQMLAKQQIEKLVDRIAAEQAVAWRNKFVVEMYFSPETLRQLVATKRTAQILELLKNQEDPAYRALMTQRIVNNAHVVTHFLEREQLGTLLAMIRQDVLKQLRVHHLSQMLVTKDGENHVMVEKGQTKTIVKVAKEILPKDEWEEFIETISRDDPFMRAWLTKVGLVDLVKTIVDGKQGVERAGTLGVLMSCTTIVKHFQDDGQPFSWFELAKKQKEGAERRQFLLHFRKWNSEQLNGSQGEFRRENAEKFWELVRADNDRDWQIDMLVIMANRADIAMLRMNVPEGENRLRPFQDPKELDWLWGLVQGETTENRQKLRMILFDSGFVRYLIEKDHFDAMIKMAKTQEIEQRGLLLGAIIAAPEAVELLQKTNRLDMVFSLMKDDSSAEGKASFFITVARSSPLVSALFAADKGETLLAAVKGIKENELQSEIWIEIVCHPVIVSYFSKQKRLSELLKMGNENVDDYHRQRYLSTFFRHDFAIKELIGDGQLEALLDTAERSAKKSDQLELFAWLIRRSPNAEMILKHPRADKFMNLFGDSQIEVENRFHWMALATGDAATIEVLVKYGYMERLLAWSSHLRRDMYSNIRNRLLESPDVWKRLIKGKRLEETILPTFQQSGLSQRKAFVQRILETPSIVNVLLKEHQTKFLADMIRDADLKDWSKLLTRAFAESPEGIKLMVEGDVFVEVLSMLHDKSLPGKKDMAVDVLIQNEPLRRKLREAGKTKEIDQLLAIEVKIDANGNPGDGDPFRLSGRLGKYLLNGDFDAAEEMLKPQPTSLYEHLRWINLLATSGRLPENIQKRKAQLNEKASSDERLILMMMLLANGELAAREVATIDVDPDRHFGLSAEALEWRKAAQDVTDLLAMEPNPAWLIRPANHRNFRDNERRIDLLATRTSYLQLAFAEGHGKPYDWQKDLQELAQIAATTKDPFEKWAVAKTILQVGDVSEGLKLLRQADPFQAFELLLDRYEIAEALRVAGVDGNTRFDQKWYDEKLTVAPPAVWPRVHGHRWSTPVTAPESYNPYKLDFAARVAAVLRDCGRTQDAEKVISLIEMALPPRSSDRNSSSNADPTLLALACLLREGHYDLATKVMNQRLLPIQVGTATFGLYPEKAQIAYSINQRLEKVYPKILPSERLQKLDRIMKGKPTPVELSEVLNGCEPNGQRTADRWVDHWLAQTFGRIHALQGNYESANACLELASIGGHADYVENVDVLRKMQNWAEVAHVAESAWEVHRDTLVLPFLAADAWDRLGNKERAEELRKKGSLCILGSQERYNVALELTHHGLHDDAERQFELVLRTDPLRGEEFYRARLMLGRMLFHTKPAVAAKHWELYHTYSMRAFWHPPDMHELLNLPLRVRYFSARRGLEAGDFERTQKEIAQALVINPGAAWLAIELVPILEKAGRKAEASSLFEKQWAYLSTVSNKYPTLAKIHNDAAWLAAKCGRKLDEALKHAETAVKLNPNSATYLDTLAEVQFQRHDRKSAVKYAKQALELVPNDNKSIERLKHFETAP